MKFIHINHLKLYTIEKYCCSHLSYVCSDFQYKYCRKFCRTPYFVFVIIYMRALIVLLILTISVECPCDCKPRERFSSNYRLAVYCMTMTKPPISFYHHPPCAMISPHIAENVSLSIHLVLCLLPFWFQPKHRARRLWSNWTGKKNLGKQEKYDISMYIIFLW